MKSKKKNLFMAMLIVATCITLISCKKKESSAVGEPSYGRYVESELMLPENLLQVIGCRQTDDGTIEVLAGKSQTLCFYSSLDGGRTYEEKSMPFLENIENSKIGYNIITAEWDKTGRLYLYLTVMEDTKNENSDYYSAIGYIDDAGKLELLPFSIPSSSSGVWPQTMRMTDDGDFLLDCVFSVLHIDGKTGKLIREYTIPVTNAMDDTEINGIDVYENNLAFSNCAAIFIYDLQTGKQLDKFIPDDVVNSNQEFNTSYSDDYKATLLVQYGKEGALYFINNNGLFRCINNNTVFEKIIDGGLTSLSIPSVKRMRFFIRNDTFLLLNDSQEQFSFLHYVYDETVPTLPSEELVVYSLNDNPTIRQSIGLFQRSNPQVHIIYEVGLKEGADPDDVLKKLTAKMLAGDGPDILLLDDLPFSTYEKKSMLLDLSDFIKESISESDYIPSVLKSYERENGSVFALPLRYRVPLMLLDKEDDAKIQDLSSLADWAKKNKDRYEMPVNTPIPEYLLRIFYPVVSSSLLAENGQIEENALSEFLKNIKELQESSPNNSANATMDSPLPGFDFEALPWMKKRYGVSAGLIAFAEQTYAPYTTFAERKGMITTLFHENVFIPHTILSINAQSSKKETALQFLKSSLSEKVLTYNFKDGLPVSVQALKNNMKLPKFDEKKPWENRYSFYATSDIMLEIKYPDQKFQDQMFEIFTGVDKASAADHHILSIIMDEASSYFHGEHPLEETVKILKDKINTYLSEQG